MTIPASRIVGDQRNKMIEGAVTPGPVMQYLFTIGTQGMTDETFIAVLKQHRVDAVIDIRLRNEGRYYRFASGMHIKALVEAHGIAYRHDTRFSPTAEMLANCAKERMPWNPANSWFQSQLRFRGPTIEPLAEPLAPPAFGGRHKGFCK